MDLLNMTNRVQIPNFTGRLNSGNVYLSNSGNVYLFLKKKTKQSDQLSPKFSSKTKNSVT